jgi:diketogulonate reductase-like aldo/keto reductase
LDTRTGTSLDEQVPRVDLGGVAMPLIGYGTHPMRAATATDAVVEALDVGYRLVDTATRYRNEDAIGAVWERTGVPRDQVFVTTKMPPDQVGRERLTLEQSLAALRTDHIDLWLVHWPPGGHPGVTSWREFVRARDEGLVRAIGVSNYSVELIDRLHAETGVYPAVNQLQWGPGDFDPDFAEAMRSRGIVISAHSSLRSTDLGHPVLVEIAALHGRTVPEVVVRWGVHHGVAVTVKSAHRSRMEQNLGVVGFALDDAEVAAIDDLDGRHERRRRARQLSAAG